MGHDEPDGRGLLRRGGYYVVVGVAQLAVDWGLFVVLSTFGMPAGLANSVGRFTGAILGFFLNGIFTFSVSGQRMLGWRRFWRFWFCWGVMTIAGSYVIHLIELSSGLKWAWVVKPFIDILFAFIGFLASRYWIYR